MNKLIKFSIGVLVFIIIVGIAFYSTMIYVPNRTVQGIVRDSITNKPVAGVEVIIDQNVQITIDDGFYKIKVKNGSHIMTIKKNGYKKFTGILNVESDIKKDIHIYQEVIK